MDDRHLLPPATETPLARARRGGGARRGAALAALAALAILASPVPAGPGTEPVEIEVVRVRPAKPRHATLRFLRENRDWIRARFDRVRTRALDRAAVAGEIDPRFLAYRDLRAEVGIAADSLALLRTARERQTLLTSVSDLGALEVRLDRLERVLAQQRARLGVLEAGFTGDQRTALVVVVSGTPRLGDVDRIDLAFEHGETIVARLTDEQRAALARGGVLEIFHGLVEPREQMIELSVEGERRSSEPGFLTLDPTRDRLTFLRLDLATLGPDAGAAAVRATTWRNDAVATGDERGR